MKRYILAFFTFLLLFGAFPAKGFSLGENQQRFTDSEYQVIPDDAIRLRILANSDKDDDQELKRQIRDVVNKEITKWVEDVTEIEQAREMIQDRLDDIEAIVESELEAKGLDYTYKVEYGKNVNFPTKVYGEYIYPAGEYEAILISLGEAKGANWWCVLFPPLCFLDFSNGSSVAEEEPEEKEKKKEEKQEDEKKFVAEEEPEEEEVEFKFFFMKWFS
ncbi:stage II sporulation protein R [Aquibacillus koreensis]|uniref:Stage II sporulation protein R n=2 Tax=Aquibacillus koreensis TaxID=279446 RepID=A0A9X4AI98_9BACI|nr:stage II sporulation protein R [Aquibacillus koreensis]MCT2538296.1 stage II sporulation protein R [Aquibacillus koreensis]MDC3420761.1 stage II sporulation protein R [Aquibacillus koreensis]